MNIANVTSRFLMLSGADSADFQKWKMLIDDACGYVSAHTAVREPDEEQTRRLEMLSAAYAFRLYCMCNDDNLTSFSAGDVKFTSSDSGKNRGERLWSELCSQNGDLISTGGFLFGRM